MATYDNSTRFTEKIIKGTVSGANQTVNLLDTTATTNLSFFIIEAGLQHNSTSGIVFLEKFGVNKVTTIDMITNTWVDFIQLLAGAPGLKTFTTFESYYTTLNPPDEWRFISSGEIVRYRSNNAVFAAGADYYIKYLEFRN
jgi:hypothetical protein